MIKRVLKNGWLLKQERFPWIGYILCATGNHKWIRLPKDLNEPKTVYEFYCPNCTNISFEKFDGTKVIIGEHDVEFEQLGSVVKVLGAIILAWMIVLLGWAISLF